MLSMAESEIFVRPNELDTDPYLLNFLNGTVDLRTGELRPHDPRDLITKLVHYRYSPQATCPRWRSFLDEVMGGGPDASEGDLARACRMVEYLRRALGYHSRAAPSRERCSFPSGKATTARAPCSAPFRQLIDEYAVLPTGRHANGSAGIEQYSG